MIEPARYRASPTTALFFVLIASCTREAPQATAKPVASEATSITPPKGPTGIAWGAPVSDLRLGIELEGTTLVAHLQNVGTTPFVVMSHIATHERQNDWLTVTVTDAKSTEHVLAFDDDRDKSASVTAKLAPGAELVDRWDLAAWSSRPRNGKRTFNRSFASLRATYKVIPPPTSVPPIGDKLWSGTVESGRIER